MKKDYHFVVRDEVYNDKAHSQLHSTKDQVADIFIYTYKIDQFAVSSLPPN